MNTESFAERLAALQGEPFASLRRLTPVRPERQTELDKLQRDQDIADVICLGKRRTFADLMPRLYHSLPPGLAGAILGGGLEPRKPVAPDPDGVYLGLGFALRMAFWRSRGDRVSDIFILEIDTAKLDASNILQRDAGGIRHFVNAKRNPRAVYEQIRAERVRNECFSSSRIPPDAFASCVQIPLVEVQEILDEINRVNGTSEDDEFSAAWTAAIQWIFDTRRQSIEAFRARLKLNS